MGERMRGGAAIKAIDLSVAFTRDRSRPLAVLDSVDFDLPAGGALGIVGESGSGKSILCRSLIGTLPRHGATITGGKLLIDGHDFARATEARWREVRGRVVGYVPQASLAGLNPILTVRQHIFESLAVAKRLGRAEANREALRLLSLVRIAKPTFVLDSRSHQLSGGMRQRVMIALALAQRPRVLIADEPTTALDVTVQHEILRLIAELRAELGMSLIFVSHDLAVVNEVCDQLLVLYAGMTVELVPRIKMAGPPLHPYTRALRQSILAAVPPRSALPSIRGEPPALGSWPDGCRFAPRCEMVQERCRVGSRPTLRSFEEGSSACLRAEELVTHDLALPK